MKRRNLLRALTPLVAALLGALTIPGPAQAAHPWYTYRTDYDLCLDVRQANPNNFARVILENCSGDDNTNQNPAQLWRHEWLSDTMATIQSKINDKCLTAGIGSDRTVVYLYGCYQRNTIDAQRQQWIVQQVGNKYRFHNHYYRVTREYLCLDSYPGGRANEVRNYLCTRDRDEYQLWH